jgi:hypothetical protein
MSRSEGDIGRSGNEGKGAIAVSDRPTIEAPQSFVNWISDKHVRMWSAKILAISSASLAAIQLMSCTSLQPPPEKMAAFHYGATDPYGYVSSVGYFTPAQMKDSAWEFRRIQAAAGSFCAGYRYEIRRDVQWFATVYSDRRKCARVTYTYRCVASEDIGKPIPDDALQATRAEVMARPIDGPLDGHCGEKDLEKLHPKRMAPDAQLKRTNESRPHQ